MMLKNSRGVSNLGCLFTLAVVVCGFYAGYKFALVQWNVETLREKMTEAAQFWANENIENIMTVKADVIRRAEVCGFALSEEDISVNTEGAYITITASWVEPIVFPGYVYPRKIEVTRSIRKMGH